MTVRFLERTQLISLNAFILLFLLTNQLSGQTVFGYVVYDWYQNMGLPNQSQAVLYFNKNESVFKELKESQEHTNSNDSLQTFNIKKEVERYIYTNLKTQKIISQELVLTEAFIVNEGLSMIKWEILDDHQKVGNYNSQRAVGSFRGRTYEVWFTSDLPISFGPWKLRGLPGLILKVVENKGKIVFEATQISINENSQMQKILNNIKVPDVGKKIALKEFVILKDNEAENLFKYLISKEGRASGLIDFQNAGRDFKYETEYEWEKKPPPEKGNKP